MISLLFSFRKWRLILYGVRRTRISDICFSKCHIKRLKTINFRFSFPVVNFSNMFKIKVQHVSKKCNSLQQQNNKRLKSNRYAMRESLPLKTGFKWKISEDEIMYLYLMYALACLILYLYTFQQKISFSYHSRSLRKHNILSFGHGVRLLRRMQRGIKGGREGGNCAGQQIPEGI